MTTSTQIERQTNTDHNFLILRGDIHDPLRGRTTSRRQFAEEKRAWQGSLDPSQLTARTILGAQWGQFLGNRSGPEILILTRRYSARATASEELLEKLGILYNIPGSTTEVSKAFATYAADSDSFMDRFTKEVAYPGSGHLGRVNEVVAEKDPLNLILMAVDRGWAPKARFEAKEKLLLMSIIASIDRRQRMTGLTNPFSDFNWFLDKYVWSQEKLKGESDPAYMVSTHNPETWACPPNSAFILSPDKKAAFHPDPNQKITQLLVREFIAKDGRVIPAFVSSRDKDLYSKTEKMLRKRSENPATAVDDDLGLMAVFENVNDIREFLDILINPSPKKGSNRFPLIPEEISDTLKGGDYKGNPGSSSKIRMLKLFLRLAYQTDQMKASGITQQMRPELILHTLETYGENLYRRGVGHLYYEINRRIASGIVGVMLPPEFYDFNEKLYASYALERARQEIEDTQPYTNGKNGLHESEPDSIGAVDAVAEGHMLSPNALNNLLEGGKRFWRGLGLPKI